MGTDQVFEAISNLKKNRFNVEFFQTCEDGIKYILDLIPKKSTIGFGGSVTVKESGLLDALIKDDYILNHRDLLPDVPKPDLYKKMHNSDWYISSTNALTKTGCLVNIDGRGNRVAAMLDGPKNLVIITGTNKLVDSIEDGISRTRNVATPKNCVRLNKKTPCAIVGHCCNCNSEETICNATVIQHHPMNGKNVYIVLIDKNLGY